MTDMGMYNSRRRVHNGRHEEQNTVADVRMYSSRRWGCRGSTIADLSKSALNMFANCSYGLPTCSQINCKIRHKEIVGEVA